MPSPSKSETPAEHSRRHRILVAARGCMLERGYPATTVDDICKAAEVTKGAFFHHFESKEAMAREVLDRFIEGLLAPMSFARDPRVQADPLKRIGSMFDQLASAYEGMGNDAGCLIGLFVMELGLINDEFRQRCRSAFEVLRDGIERELEKAIKLHGVRNADPRQLADGAVAAVQGAVIMARANRDAAGIRAALENYFALLTKAIPGSE